MASLFISHSSRDASIAIQVVAQLRNSGFGSLFIDFDPDCGIAAGRDWERELYVQLRKADGVVFLGSQMSNQSPWCFAELALARSMGKLVFPVLIGDAERHPLLDRIQGVRWDPGRDDGALDRLLSSLSRSGLDSGRSIAWDPTRNPYPGLVAFTELDAAVFFGREKEIRCLLDLIETFSIRGLRRLVTIVGPSGSGKSSLVRAGLIPRLLRVRDPWVVMPRITPGEQPIAAFARCLALAFRERGIEPDPVAIESRLHEGPAALVHLLADLRDRSARREDARFLLFVDQLEELLTLAEGPDRTAFLALLDSTLASESPVSAVATLRSEFLDSLLREPQGARLLNTPLFLGALDQALIPEIIEGPAARVGLDFAPGLVARMATETQGGDALPMLAYTLRELYDRVGADMWIGANLYDSLGGIVGALQRQADQVAAAIERQGWGALMIPTLLKLTIIEDNQPVRRRVRRQSLSSIENVIVQTFIEARLLKSDGEGDEATVQVAHEALLRQWTPLRRAIDDARGDLTTATRLNQLAHDWEQAGGHESYLLTGPGLQRMLRWAAVHSLSELESAFLEASTLYAKASLGRRGCAVFIDFFIALIIVVTAFETNLFGIANALGETPLYPNSFHALYVTNFLALSAIGYRFGGTPGMRMFGLTLVSTNGDTVTWRQAILRALLIWAPFKSRMTRTAVLNLKLLSVF